jgi:hypothetical protein
MRTTINLDDQLLKEAKAAAAAADRSLSELIEEALRERLGRRQAQQRRKRVSLPTFRGQGVRPGIDLKDWGSVLDVMDQHDAAP